MTHNAIIKTCLNGKFLIKVGANNCYTMEIV